jgi:hypothetical protein
MMNRVGQVARMEEMINAYEMLVGKPEGKNLEDLSVDGKIILKWILLRKGGMMWTECN